MTSLGDDERLSWFSEAAGLEDATHLRVGSPFDYEAHARVYVPPRFPAPNDAAHNTMVGRAAAHGWIKRAKAAMSRHTGVTLNVFRCANRLCVQ